MEKKEIPQQAISSYERTLRWQTCQKIGVVFYRSILSSEQIDRYLNFFATSDFIADILPPHRDRYK